MKRKLIITNILIVSFSLILMLVISILVISNADSKNTNNIARSYLTYATEKYDGGNETDIIEDLETINSSVRVTFIDANGKVIVDSSNLEINENHLDRDEIKNLGKIYKRYSQTMKCNMLYIAANIDGYDIYVRISIPTSDINTITSTYLGVGFVLLFVILAVSTTLILYFIKREVDPINTSVKELARIADKDIVNPSIDDMADIIGGLNLTLNDKIRKIDLERTKLKDVINEINTGLILIDKRSNIGIVNLKALEIFKVTLDACEGKNMLYLIRDSKLQEEITEALNNKKYTETSLKIDDKTYKVLIKYIEADWTLGSIIVRIEDVSGEINLEQTKREFFANASHELKSPLTSIMGYLQMITQGIAEDKDSILEYSNKSLSEATRMNSIIGDMLDLSKLEGKENINISTVNVTNVLTEILEGLESKIKQKNITVSCDVSDVILETDYNHIYELIRNLVDNAIKYNKQDGSIYITLNDQCFEVKDSGIGIPLEDQKHVFERFYRVDKAKSKTLGGTGLGLAIVKHICEIHKYEIRLKSIEDVGTTIQIVFSKMEKSN